MRGVGTKLAITSDRSGAVVLDITRLVSRVGRGPLTGVDRVELAYLEWALTTMAPLHCLARLADGYALLDRAGAEGFHQRFRGDADWGARDFRARVGFKTPPVRGRAESDVRRMAVARSGKGATPKLPNGVYLNVGHSSLSDATLSSVSRQGMRIAVLIHDMIPLDFPEYQRPDEPEKFERKMRRVAAHADLIIANSKDTERRVSAYFQSWNAAPEYVTAHLGVAIANPPDRPQKRPYYCAIGTIEPRKNHALLLDIWEDMAEGERPDLHIVGQRGWNNAAVFSRLDALQGAPWLHEHNSMPDLEVTTLLSGAHGLLFPSHAEGFGLPSLEAVQLGIPVICGDLAIHHELLGGYPVYAGLEDRFLWKKTVLEQARQRQKDLVRVSQAKTVKIPTWSEHFNAVNAALKSLA